MQLISPRPGNDQQQLLPLADATPTSDTVSAGALANARAAGNHPGPGGRDGAADLRCGHGGGSNHPANGARRRGGRTDHPGPAGLPLTATVPTGRHQPGQATIDGQAQGGGKVAPGAPLVLTVAGRAGVAATGQVTAVALNVTAVESQSGGSFVTVYPANEARPLASNLNVDAGPAVANSVIAKLSPTGQVRIYVSAPMHLIVDVAGYWASGGITSLSPVRLATPVLAQARSTVSSRASARSPAVPRCNFRSPDAAEWWARRPASH